MLVKLLKYKLIIFLIFSSLFSVSQEVRVAATLDTNSILIGDQIRLNLQFSGPSGTRVRWPLFADTLTKNLNIVRYGTIDTIPSEDQRLTLLTQRLTITSFDSGYYAIPPIPFYYVEDQDTTVRMAETYPLLLAVHSVAVDTTQPIKPIKGPMKVPLTFREILPWLLLALAILLVIGGVFYYLKKRKKAEPVFSFKPKLKLKPWEIALTELEKLRAKKLWQQGQIKLYYTELTDILRRYLEARFSILAMESTSAEILHDLLAKPELERAHWDQLGQVLMLADMVKFAKALPLPEENEKSLIRATEFIQHTKEKPEEIRPSLPQTELTKSSNYS